ncbi:MAG: hypothetical protein PUF89_03190 [Lactobacillus porci]|nr:hypothetical protein [Lactobacillus porci]
MSVKQVARFVTNLLLSFTLFDLVLNLGSEGPKAHNGLRLTFIAAIFVAAIGQWLGGWIADHAGFLKYAALLVSLYLLAYLLLVRQDDLFWYWIFQAGLLAVNLSFNAFTWKNAAPWVTWAEIALFVLALAAATVGIIKGAW